MISIVKQMSALVVLMVLLTVTAAIACAWVSIVYFMWFQPVRSCKCMHMRVTRTRRLPTGWFNPGTHDGRTFVARWLADPKTVLTFRAGLLQHGINTRLIRTFDEDMRPVQPHICVADGNTASCDMRPFERNGRTVVVTSTQSPVVGGCERPSIMDPTTGALRFIRYRNPTERDKNWTPLQRGRHTYFYTDCEEGGVLLFRRMSFASPTPTEAEQVRFPTTLPRSSSVIGDHLRWRGGSNWVEMRPGIYWGIMHAMTTQQTWRKLYRSILVEIDWQARSTRCTPELCFDANHARVQFVTGMYKKDADTIGVSLGLHDRVGVVHEYAIKDVDALLK